MHLRIHGSFVVSAGNHRRPRTPQTCAGAAAVTDVFYNDFRLQPSLYSRKEFLFYSLFGTKTILRASGSFAAIIAPWHCS